MIKTKFSMHDFSQNYDTITMSNMSAMAIIFGIWYGLYHSTQMWNKAKMCVQRRFFKIWGIKHIYTNIYLLYYVYRWY